MVIYEGGRATTQARSLWRIEPIRTKWHGALVGYEQAFRIRHITTGRYLGVSPSYQQNPLVNHNLQLYNKDKATHTLSAFIMWPSKDIKKQPLEEKEEEGMGVATIRYGETTAFIWHVDSKLWLSYQTNEVTKKGVGKCFKLNQY